jgi:hypothetical protein
MFSRGYTLAQLDGSASRYAPGTRGGSPQLLLNLTRQHRITDLDLNSILDGVVGAVAYGAYRKAHGGALRPTDEAMQQAMRAMSSSAFLSAVYVKLAEDVYNAKRRHSALGYESPVAIEEEQARQMAIFGC